MTAVALDDPCENGGFPEPPPSAPVRAVTVRHGCGARTIVRLPAALPATAVRRLRCVGCQQTYESDAVEEIGARAAAQPSRRSWATSAVRSRRIGRWLSLPVGAAAVIGALVLIQGADTTPDRPTAETASIETGEAAGAGGDGEQAVAATSGRSRQPASASRQGARLVRGSRFALALPAEWRRTDTPDGASFAAAAPSREADATLWIEHAPELGMEAFEARSLEQLRGLAGNARVAERVSAPSAEATIIRLAADAPEGEPQLEVTLRAAGPYRYYLATTLQPDASRPAADGVELIHGSFIPEIEGTR